MYHLKYKLRKKPSIKIRWCCLDFAGGRVTRWQDPFRGSCALNKGSTFSRCATSENRSCVIAKKEYRDVRVWGTSCMTHMRLESKTRTWLVVVNDSSSGDTKAMISRSLHSPNYAWLIRSWTSGWLLTPDENRIGVQERKRERESWQIAEIWFARITAILWVISRSGLRKESDYVTQCVGCLTITAWVKDQSIGIINGMS